MPSTRSARPNPTGSPGLPPSSRDAPLVGSGTVARGGVGVSLGFLHREATHARELLDLRCQPLDDRAVLLAELSGGDLLVGVDPLQVLVDHGHAHELLAVDLERLHLELGVLAVGNDRTGLDVAPVRSRQGHEPNLAAPLGNRDVLPLAVHRRADLSLRYQCHVALPPLPAVWVSSGLPEILTVTVRSILSSCGNSSPLAVMSPSKSQVHSSAVPGKMTTW